MKNLIGPSLEVCHLENECIDPGGKYGTAKLIFYVDAALTGFRSRVLTDSVELKEFVFHIFCKCVQFCSILNFFYSWFGPYFVHITEI